MRYSGERRQGCNHYLKLLKFLNKHLLFCLKLHPDCESYYQGGDPGWWQRSAWWHRDQ